MSIVRIIVGIVSFFLVWFVVAVVIGFVVNLVFPPAGGTTTIGIGWDARRLPGTLLGLLAGIQSFRASVRANNR